MIQRKHIFSQLNSGFRSKLAQYILQARRRDRAKVENSKKWHSQSRTMEDYCRRLGVMPDYLETMFQYKMNTQPAVNILDAGAGQGEAIRNILEKFGGRIQAWSVGLTYRPLSTIMDRRHRVGLFETMTFDSNFFDFIFSVRGAFSYSLNSFSSAETALNSLRIGGMAFLEDSRLLWPQEWFRNYLEQNGFITDITRYEKGLPEAFKISRQRPGVLDLTRFSERFFSLVQQKETIFLKWGFDRLEKGSPLNSLFQELYSQGMYQELL